MKFSIAGFALILLLSSTISAGWGGDVIPAGMKNVRHELVFSNLKAFPAHDFYLLMPENWDREPIRLVEDEPVTFYKFLDATLAALEKGVEPQGRENLVASSDRVFSLDKLARSGSRVARRVSNYRIEAIEEGKVLVEDLGTVAYDDDGEVVQGGLVEEIRSRASLWIALGAAVALVVLFISRRRRQT